MSKKYAIYNPEKIEFMDEPLFFGTGRNQQRYDKKRFPFYFERAQTMQSFFWKPKEISLIKDRADFKKLSEAQEFVFKSNISYQVLLDSVQGRTPAMLFLPFCTNPEFERCTIIWTDFEGIHSESYSHILQEIYADPSVIFDDIMKNEEIKKRAGSVVKYLEDAYTKGIMYQFQQLFNIETEQDFEPFTIAFQLFIDAKNKKLKEENENAVELNIEPHFVSLHELKKALYLSIVAINVLEGLRFYVSFACSFAFAEIGLLLGNANILKLIARDEITHLSLTQKAINTFRKKANEGFMDVAAECEAESLKIYEEAIMEEKEWASYLFSKGSILGLNEQILHLYIDHLAHERMKAIGLKPFTKAVANPITWIDKWFHTENVQDAPQETEITDYLVSAITMDVGEEFVLQLAI